MSLNDEKLQMNCRVNIERLNRSQLRRHHPYVCDRFAHLNIDSETRQQLQSGCYVRIRESDIPSSATSTPLGDPDAFSGPLGGSSAHVASTPLAVSTPSADADSSSGPLGASSTHLASTSSAAPTPPADPDPSSGLLGVSSTHLASTFSAASTRSADPDTSSGPLGASSAHIASTSSAGSIPLPDPESSSVSVESSSSAPSSALVASSSASQSTPRSAPRRIFLDDEGGFAAFLIRNGEDRLRRMEEETRLHAIPHVELNFEQEADPSTLDESQEVDESRRLQEEARKEAEKEAKLAKKLEKRDLCQKLATVEKRLKDAKKKKKTAGKDLKEAEDEIEKFKKEKIDIEVKLARLRGHATPFQQMTPESTVAAQIPPSRKPEKKTRNFGMQVAPKALEITQGFESEALSQTDRIGQIEPRLPVETGLIPPPFDERVQPDIQFVKTDSESGNVEVVTMLKGCGETSRPLSGKRRPKHFDIHRMAFYPSERGSGLLSMGEPSGKFGVGDGETWSSLLGNSCDPLKVKESMPISFGNNVDDSVAKKFSNLWNLINSFRTNNTEAHQVQSGVPPLPNRVPVLAFVSRDWVKAMNMVSLQTFSQKVLLPPNGSIQLAQRFIYDATQSASFGRKIVHFLNWTGPRYPGVFQEVDPTSKMLLRKEIETGSLRSDWKTFSKSQANKNNGVPVPGLLFTLSLDSFVRGNNRFFTGFEGTQVNLPGAEDAKNFASAVFHNFSSMAEELEVRVIFAGVLPMRVYPLEPGQNPQWKVNSNHVFHFLNSFHNEFQKLVFVQNDEKVIFVPLTVPVGLVERPELFKNDLPNQKMYQMLNCLLGTFVNLVDFL